jgi:DNA-binding CsgD family transcriptional regulator
MRRVLAAGAYLAAGATEPAEKLLERGVPHLVDPLVRAQAIRMEAALRILQGRVAEAPGLLLRAANALGDLDVHVARETLLEALDAINWAGPLGTGPSAADIAATAATLPVPPGEETTADRLLAGYTQNYTSGFAAAVEPWRRAAAEFLDDPRTELHRWQSMLWDATAGLLDYDIHRAVSAKQVRLARASGALGALPAALTSLAWSELVAGRIDAAEALFAESAEITGATGEPSLAAAQDLNELAVHVWYGREREARALAANCSAREAALGHGLAVTVVEFLLLRLDLALGRHEDARRHALHVFDNAPLSFGTVALGSVVEALAGAGDRRGAEAALARLAERASASGAPWGLGLWARSRALLAPDVQAEALYREALEHLSHSGVVSELARAHLLYGEWLRRQRRRRDARTELRQAHDIFHAAGREVFAQRAGAALLATGERTRARTNQAPARDLTRQERQIARRAAEGESNAEIAAALFISPHTVAYHLRKVFVKLGITSRNQLAAAIDADGDGDGEALTT